MKSAHEICQQAGIELRDYSLKHHYRTCPQCSAYRKPHNRQAKCLAVDINEKGVRWFCNNCGWSGYDFYEASQDWQRPQRQYGRVIERPTGRVIERPQKQGRVIERPAASGRTIERPRRRTIDGGWI
jgi:hypothetical protein